MFEKLTLVVVASSVAAMAPWTVSSAAAPATTTSLSRTIHDPRVVESSGLARSTYDRPVLWTHNDSGGDNVVFAVGAKGATRATVTLTGARPRDWEDIAAGPDHRLYVGDIGDNRKTRAKVRVYRFPEPRRLRNTSVRPTRFDLVYRDGRHNAEGLLVHPVTGRVYVVTKSTSGGAIYAAPSKLSRTGTNRMTRVASAPVKISGASFSPDGTRFALANYDTAWVYRSIGGWGAAVDKPNLKGGESISYNRTGRRLLMGSEGRNSPVYRVGLPAWLT